MRRRGRSWLCWSTPALSTRLPNTLRRLILRRRDCPQNAFRLLMFFGRRDGHSWGGGGGRTVCVARVRAKMSLVQKEEEVVQNHLRCRLLDQVPEARQQCKDVVLRSTSYRPSAVEAHRPFALGEYGFASMCPRVTQLSSQPGTQNTELPVQFRRNIQQYLTLLQRRVWGWRHQRRHNVVPQRRTLLLDKSQRKKTRNRPHFQSPKSCIRDSHCEHVRVSERRELREHIRL